MEPPVESGLDDYNPRCIRRDLNAYVSSKFYTTENLLNLTIGDASATVELFQNEFNGRPQDNGFMGLRKRLSIMFFYSSYLLPLPKEFSYSLRN